jgi:hypothetical protein
VARLRRATPSADQARRSMPRPARIRMVNGSAALAVAAALFAAPFDVPESYYHFADTRALFGVANFADVVSNLAFLAAGVMGLAWLCRPAGRACLTRRERAPFAIFFAGVVATTFGSGAFHLAPLTPDGDPNNWGMLWDRLPITVAFTALFAGFIADRVSARAGAVALPLAVAFGVAATVYWYVTAWPGDLRFYALVQAYPALAIPLLCWLFPGRLTSGRHVAWLLAFYGLAKVCEAFDRAIFDFLGGVVSGHTVKHLLAALSVYVVLVMLRRAPAADVADHSRPDASLSIQTDASET